MTHLYDFQIKGVNWLVEHHGGFLFDDPGLGKTRQAIVAAVRLGVPCLIVCPNSLKQWWRREIQTVVPTMTVAISGRGGRFGRRNVIPMPNPLPDFVVVHYEGLRINAFSFKKIRWITIIVDEAHYAKNRNADRTKALMEVSSGVVNRIGLTATPFGRNPADIWAQLRWLAPQHPGLKSYWRFYNTFVLDDFERRGSGGFRKITGTQNMDLLARVMTKFGIRRTKKEVAKELPEIMFTQMPIAMNGSQESIYKQLVRKSTVEFEFWDADKPVSKMVITNALARMIRLEQWLSHPWTWKPNIKGAKLEWLMEWAEGYDKPAVIATRFRASAVGVAQALGKDRCRLAITGDWGVDVRDDVINDWKAGKHQFLVGTIDTIGIGLSFEQAHAMICYDQLYSTTKMEQLVHRVHRITTDHPVQVIYIYVPETTNQLVLESFTQAWQQIELVRRFLEQLQGSKYV